MRDTYSYLLATLPIPEYRQVAIPSRQLLGHIIDSSYHYEGYLLLEQLFKVLMVESPKYWVDSQVMGDAVGTGTAADGVADATVTATSGNTADEAQYPSVGFGTVVYASCRTIKAFLSEHIELVAHTTHEPLIDALHSTTQHTLQAQSHMATESSLDDAAKQEHIRHEEYWTMLKMELELVHKQSVDAASDIAVIHPIVQAYQNWRQFYFGLRGEIARSSVLAQSHDQRVEWPHTDSQYVRNLLLDIENSDNPLTMSETIERLIFDWIYAQFGEADSPAVVKLFWYYLLTVNNERLALMTEVFGRQVLDDLIASNKRQVHTLITDKLRQAGTTVAG